MAPIEPDAPLDELYDDETLARIDRPVDGPPAPRPAPRPPVSGARRRGAAMAVATGIALGLREVFEPPEPAQITAVDPWSDDRGATGRVRFHWHPEPPSSTAEISS